MKKNCCKIVISLFIFISTNNHADTAYFERFSTYLAWSQNLPRAPDPQFLKFINDDRPLAKKLREKWLYQLAYNKDWTKFSEYYQGSTDTNLQCYASLATYSAGNHQKAFIMSKNLWLNGSSQPTACNNLFLLLMHDGSIDNELIQQRIHLALEKRNVKMATYLLKQHHPALTEEANILQSVVQNPMRILRLSPSKLHGEFYLYGLKTIITRNIETAVRIWRQPQTARLLNTEQQQSFLVQLTLYKAMRNNKDTPLWFAKIKPAFYDSPLLEWQIRFALLRSKWSNVERLINLLGDKEAPCWQYWRARALAAMGNKETATAIFKKLALTRNYYGFLASNQLKSHLNFENNTTLQDNNLLKPYKPFMEQIKNLYILNKRWEASSLLNTFISELPQYEKTALISWIANQLQWYGKSVYLSNNDELKNQLVLRFPLAYQRIIMAFSARHQISAALIYAMIRQESAFRDDVISTAGAHGLMQIMPLTAQKVCANAKIPFKNKTQLFSAPININIGAAYLKELSLRFHKHPILMIAAYNAGPRQVNYWLQNHPPKDIDIWIETLPWQETRNYLKNVIAFYAVYQYRMQERPSLHMFMQPFYKP